MDFTEFSGRADHSPWKSSLNIGDDLDSRGTLTFDFSKIKIESPKSNRSKKQPAALITAAIISYTSGWSNMWENNAECFSPRFIPSTIILTGSLAWPAPPLQTFSCVSRYFRNRPRQRMSADSFQHFAHLHSTVRSWARTAEQGSSGTPARYQHEDEERREKHHWGTCVFTTD